MEPLWTNSTAERQQYGITSPTNRRQVRVFGVAAEDL